MSEPQKIKIIALIDQPYVNTVETIYEEAQKDNRFSFTFVVVPNTDPRSTISYEYLKEMMEKHNFPYLDGMKNDNTFLDIASLHPDIVLMQTPYDMQRPKEFSAAYIGSFSRIILLSYGATILDYDVPPYDELISKNHFYDSIWFVAMENKMLADQMEKYHPGKYVPIGYLKLDNFLHYQQNVRTKTSDRYKNKIAWKPRWVATLGDSNFLRYIDFFISLCGKRQDTFFLFVLHPLLKSTLIDRRIYTSKEVYLLFERLNQIDNLKIIERDDFLDDIADCDIFIGDYCSTIIEAMILDKKIIYTPTEISYSEFGEKFLEACYIVNNTEELNITIEKLLNGNDPKKNKRDKFHSIAVHTVKNGSFAKYFLEYLAENFVKEQKKEQKEQLPLSPSPHQPKRKMTLRNKIRYKIWKHLGKKLHKKGII